MSKRESQGGAKYQARDFLGGRNPEARDSAPVSNVTGSVSPGKARAEALKDDHEEFVRRTWSERGGPLLGHAKTYDTSEDVIVPLGDERHVRRTLPPIIEHRNRNAPAGGDTISRVPFVLDAKLSRGEKP